MPRFRAAHTQVLGISVDSIYCHANWGVSLGGVSFPLLADFHPKGAVADAFGLYLPDKGITDRATVLIDCGGTVRHASSVSPAGERSIEDLAALCEGTDRECGAGLKPFPQPPGLEPRARLYIRSNCGFSRAVLLARDNLHLQAALPVENVSEDAAALDSLREVSGKEQAPCLMLAGQPVFEAPEIIRYLVSQATDL